MLTILPDPPTKHAMEMILNTNIVHLLCELIDVMHKGFQDDPNLMTDECFTRTIADILYMFDRWGGTVGRTQSVVGAQFLPRLCNFLATRDKDNSKLTKEALEATLSYVCSCRLSRLLLLLSCYPPSSNSGNIFLDQLQVSSIMAARGCFLQAVLRGD
jgi:hypothetical protein